MDKIRAVIVDDERPARTRIRELLERTSDIAVVGEYADGAAALAGIPSDAPDLLFMDIQMPEMDGFNVIAGLDSGSIPTTIFVTAYDRYALKAFDVHALDYLLKPFSDERFEVALGRARSTLRRNESGMVGRAIEAILASRSALDRIAVKTTDRTYFVKTARIDWIEAAGAYVQLHAQGKTHLVRSSISGLEERLDSRQFIRIHRSAIVNVDAIAELRPLYHGEQIVVLEDGKELKLSRTYRSRLQDRLDRPV